MKVSIIGLGKSGVSAANMMSAKGYEVFVSESASIDGKKDKIGRLSAGITFETGGHTDRALDAGLIIKSPGVPENIPVIQEARRRKIEIISEIEAACRFIKPKKMIAVTGTNGKTTTVTLTGDIFKNAGEKTFVAGNIGSPLSDFVGMIDSSSIVVLEVSSYQLEDIKEFLPDVAVVLNITPDHLEHHGSVEEYYQAKKKIALNQRNKDFCVLNYDDSGCRRMGAELSGGADIIYFSKRREKNTRVFTEGGNFEAHAGGNNYQFPDKLLLPGEHNVENALAALSAAACCGVPQAAVEKTFAEFKGVEHRLEFAGETGGVIYINDSKSTNVDSTAVALKSFSNPLILIMGGRHKGFPYTPLRELMRGRVKHLLLIGESSSLIMKDLKGAAKITECGNIEKALALAKKDAQPGDLVLFSPGCSSFDQFADFEHRGKYFKELVNALK